MKLFKLRADATFFAEDIDDALDRLSAHFTAPFQADFIESGEIVVEPLDKPARQEVKKGSPNVS